MAILLSQERKTKLNAYVDTQITWVYFDFSGLCR